MSKVLLSFTLATSVLLAACQGGSNSSSGNEVVNNDFSSVICPSGEVFEIEGVELITELYDRDKDGCLSGFEYRVATRVAQQMLALEEKQLVVDGVTSSSSISKIYSMKVIGSSEVSDNKIQLHSNIDSGDFHISFKTYSTNSPDESLKLYFDDESAMFKSGTAPSYAITLPLPPIVGEVSYIFSCRYMSDMSVNCTSLLVARSDYSGGDYMTLDLDVSFPLRLTFAEESLPKAGYIIGTFCDESGDDANCLANYAQMPVSFN